MRYAVVVYIILSVSLAYGNQADTLRHHSLKINPQLVFLNQFRVDYEYQPILHRNGLVVAPAYYYGRPTSLYRNRSNKETETMRGFGVEILHKFYAAKPKPETNIYLAYGPEFARLNIKFEDFGWVSTPNSDGLNVLDYRLIDQTQIINKVTFSLLMGLEYRYSSFAILDFYIGIATKSSRVVDKYGNESRYAQGAYDYAFEGTIFKGGIRLGILLF